MFDVFTIGVLFVARLVAGMVLIDNQISLWLSGFAFTLFMSLAMAKRHSELTTFLRSSGSTPVGRGYEAEDIGLTRAFGVGSALIAFLIMLLYFQFQALRSEEHTSELHSLMRTSYAVFCLKKKNKLTN